MLERPSPQKEEPIPEQLHRRRWQNEHAGSGMGLDADPNIGIPSEFPKFDCSSESIKKTRVIVLCVVITIGLILIIADLTLWKNLPTWASTTFLGLGIPGFCLAVIWIVKMKEIESRPLFLTDWITGC